MIIQHVKEGYVGPKTGLVQFLTLIIRLEGFRSYTTEIFGRQLNLIISSEKLKDLHFAAKFLTWTVCHDIISHVEVQKPDIQHMGRET